MMKVMGSHCDDCERDERRQMDECNAIHRDMSLLSYLFRMVFCLCVWSNTMEDLFYGIRLLPSDPR